MSIKSVLKSPDQLPTANAQYLTGKDVRGVLEVSERWIILQRPDRATLSQSS
jgi:hypothetical protein